MNIKNTMKLSLSEVPTQQEEENKEKNCMERNEKGRQTQPSKCTSSPCILSKVENCKDKEGRREK